MRILRPLVYFLQAVLIALTSFSLYVPGLKTMADHMKADMDFSKDFSFESLDDNEAKISDAEMKMCRDWFVSNILTADAPAYGFSVNGKYLRDNITD